MANKHMKRCSTSTVIKKIQIKTAMRYHLPPIRMATNKETENNVLLRVWRNWNPSALLMGM